MNAKLLFSAGTLLLTAGPLLAQSSGRTYVLLDGGIPLAPYGKTATADLDADSFLDLGVLVGSKLSVLFAPGLFEVEVNNVLTGVQDLVALPDGGPARPDSFFVVGSQGAGLVNWIVDDSFSYRRVDQGAWSGAVLVDRVPTAAGAPRVVIGVMADGLSVRRLSEDPLNPLGLWLDDPVLTLTQPVEELALADLTGSSQVELGFMHAGGVDVRDWTGAPYCSWSFPCASDALARVRNAGQKDSLAWVATDYLGSWQYVSVVSDSTSLPLWDLLGNPEAVGITAADTGAVKDEMDDLVFSYRFDHDVAIVENRGLPDEGAVFDPALALELIPFGEPGPFPTNATTPVAADLDNDGDPDILQALQDTGGYFVHMNTRTDEELGKPWIDPDHEISYLAREKVVLSFDLACDPAGLAQGTPNILELFTYHRPSVGQPMAVAPIDVQVLDLDAYDRLVGASERHFDIEIELEDSPAGECTHFESLYFIIARMAYREGPVGPVLERYPARLYGMQGQLVGGNAEYILSHTSEEEHELIIDHDCLHPPIPGAALGELGGTGDGIDCLPKPTGGGGPPLGS